MIFAETERYILRDIRLEDADAFFDMESDPEVHKYLGTQPLTGKEQVIGTIRFIQQQYLTNGIGRWAVADKTTNRFIGWSGLKLVRDEINGHTNYYDLGYRLIRSHWGQGIATETALASLSYGFERLHLNEIIATVNSENTGSNHVVTKAGFTCRETFILHGMRHYWYTLNRNEWMKRKAGL